MVCIAAELFESVGGRSGEERNMKSDRMRNKEKHNKTESGTECERFVFHLKATVSRSLMVIFTTDITEMKQFPF